MGMYEPLKQTTLALDDECIKLLDSYARKNKTSRSAAARLLIITNLRMEKEKNGPRTIP